MSYLAFYSACLAFTGVTLRCGYLRQLAMYIAMSKKRSPIWEYFKVAEGSHYAICNATSCNKSVSHGGKTTKGFQYQQPC